jgi:hypothetical protein
VFPEFLKLVVAPIIVGGLLDALHQLLRRWLSDKGDDDK